MQIQIERIKLPGLYADKSLNPNTVNAVIKSPVETVYRLYLIAAGIKETQDFATIDSEKHTLTAIVKSSCTFSGDAKRQVRTIPQFNVLLRKLPGYVLKCELRCLMTNKVLYRCEMRHKRPDIIYNQIQECINDLKQIVK